MTRSSSISHGKQHDASPPHIPLGAALLGGAVVFIATVCFCASANIVAGIAVLLIDGLFVVAWTAAACALGSAVLRRTSFTTNAPLMVATAGGLGLGIFSLIALGLGLAGWLNQLTALALPVVSVLWWGAPVLRRVRLKSIDLRIWLRIPVSPWSLLWLVPIVSLAMACMAASVVPGVMWKPMDPHPYDVVSYHLQVPREWFESGRITPLRHNVFSFFPFNVEMQYLLLMHAMGGPWNAMYACQLMSVVYAGLMVVGVFGTTLTPSPGMPGESRGEGDFDRRALLAERNHSHPNPLPVYRARGPEGVIGAAIVSVVPWTIMLAGVAYVETALMLYTTLAIAWGLRTYANDKPTGSAVGPKSNGAKFDMILAGVMAGFACGVKITAVPMLLLALPAAMLIARLVHRTPDFPLRRLLGGCAVFIVAGSLILSPWLIRNFAWCGNPIFPLAMKTLGRAHFSDGQAERFRIAHSPPPEQASIVGRLNVARSGVLAHWQFGYIILPVALLAAMLRWRDRQTWALLVTAALMFLVWIGFTHLLGRFLVMLVPIAGILIGRMWWNPRAPLVGVVIVLIAAGISWVNLFPPLARFTRDPVRSALIGVQNLSFMVPQELSEMKEKQVGLVGDAGAFLYQIPMSRLHYRTVFDVPVDIADPIEAWVGPEAKGNPGWLLVIHPGEIDRLHQTYRQIPALPEWWRERGEQPFVLRGEDATK